MRRKTRLPVRFQLFLLLAISVIATGLVVLVVSFALVRASLAPRTAERLPASAVVNGSPRAVVPTQAVAVTRAQLAQETLSALSAEYAAMLAGLVIVAGLFGWLVAGRALRRLRIITEAARRINGENLHRRLALTGPADELRELGDTFDSMLARLERAFQAQQLFAANAAHELRTPLTVMRAELDLLATGPVPSGSEARQAALKLRRTVIASQGLLERLLTLTRGMVAPEEHEPVPLDAMVQWRLAIFEPEAGEMGLNLHQELGEAVASGDPWLLGELVDNLLGNAVKHNRRNGWVLLSTRTEDGTAVLEVSNSGQGLAEKDLAGLLEPFRRGDRQRVGRGSGLGLSIVRAIVTAHGGRLAVEANEEGGLRVRASLPAGSHPLGPAVDL